MLSHALRASVRNTNIPVITDPNFNQVSLLLHGDGTNGAQNNTFLDSSTNNFTVTRNGNTTQGTNTPFSQAAGYWSYCIVNNNTTSIATPDSSSFILSADFTVEMWLNNPSTATYIPQVFNIGRGSNSDSPYASNGIMLQFTGADGVYLNGSNIGINLQSYCNSGQWMHIALCRTGSIFKIFINGTQIYSATFTAIINSGGKNVLIGSNPSVSSFGWYGYISNLRVVNGTGLYTSNFTPSATPLTAVTNTVLLTCQSNRFVDNSSNNFVITAPTGTPSVEPFSPFAPTSAYSTSVNGGSMYFDGTGDYLSVPDNLALNMATSDFTVEAFIYISSTPTNTAMVLNKDGKNSVSWPQYAIYVGSDLKVNASFSSVPNAGSGPTASITSTATLTLNQWFHVAATKSGANATLWVNGVSNGTSSSVPTTLNNGARPLLIGWEDQPVSGFNFPGYISNLRVVKGTAVYTANFTPPTAPLTAITNTSLLLSGTNAGIVDNAIKNDLETVGTAQVSTSVVKYGTGSIYCNGSGNSLTIPASQQLALRLGDFTIECWFNPSNTTFGWLYVQSIVGTLGIAWSLTTSRVSLYCNYGTAITSTSNLSTGTWYHVAVTRVGIVSTLYINGVSQGTFSGTNDVTPVTTYIGDTYTGYIDGLRVTKGIARYTANFTPPTQAFPNQ